MSALYAGWVGHRRLRPVEHAFRYRVVTAYLAYCEAGFRERRIRCGQLLLAKPGWRAAATANRLARVAA